MADATEIRFILDEHVPVSVLKGLRRRGIDVISIDEMRRKGTPDPDVLELANQLQRIIITQDTDFLAVPLPFENHAGIVFVRDGIPLGSVLTVLELLHGALTSEDMRNRIEYVANYR